MGKVNNDPIFLPEKEYNEKLNSEIGKLIDNGFNDEDIKLYGEDFKKRYQIKKKEDSREVSVSDSTSNVTRSASASNQTVPDKFAVAEDINKALLDAGYTQEQINLQQKSMNEANLGQIQEEFKFEKEENTLADRSGLPNFEGEVKTENVRVLASELDAPVSFNLEEQQKQLGNFKKLLDKGEITQDEYNDVENTITKPTKRKLARFEELKKTYNPERMEELTVKFKEAGVLSNDEISGIDREIDRKRKGDYTFLEKAKLALGFTTERKIKNININDRNAIVQQKIKNKQAEFLSGLDNDEKLLFESYLVKRNEKLQEEVKQAENFNDSIVKIAIPNEIADIKVLDEQIKSIVDKDRNSLTEEDLSNYKTLIDQRKNKEAIVNSLGEQYEVNRKTMLDNSDDLMSFDDEIDLAKRDFSFYSNRIKAIDRGFQYLTENALAFTGNTLTTIASQSGRVRDFIGDERLKNAQDIFNAWQINIAETKEKFEESIAPKKSLSDVNSISDFGSYVGDLITEQIPILATIYATGGTGLTGVTLASGGDRTGQLLKQVEAGEKEYTQEEIIGNGLLYSAGEFIGERITLGILNDYKRVFNTINKSGATKTTFKEALKKQVNGALKGVRTANQEGLSEVYTEFVQLLADDLQLNENRSGNFFEAYVGGFVMGKGIHVTGSIPNMALGAYSNSKNKRKVEANTLKVRELEQIISEGDLTDAVKSSYQQQIIDLLNDNQNTIFESADALQYLDSDQLKEITSINNQIIEVQKSLQGQTNENVSNALKGTLKQLTDRKDQILSTPQEILENLPDKGQALKEEAAKVLTEEKQNSGAKEFEITDTDITFKAAQLFQESQKNPLNLNVEETKSTASKEVKDFVEGLGVVKDTSQFIDGAMKFIQDGVSVNVGKADNGNLVLETIYVPRSERGQGKASKVLDSIIERADEQGKTMELTVAPLDDNVTFSGLINLYERKGFVKEEGFVEDGGKMIREPKSEGFESIDLVLSQTTETTEAPNIQEQKSFTLETTIETNSNTYNVSLENGNLNISPTIGNPEISRGERNRIINQYIEQTDFSQGETANFEGKGDLTDIQVSEVIANESNNPLEIAREIVRVQENSSQRINELKDTKSEAIANVLRAYPLNTESRREVTDLGRFYTSRANKTNEPISIDQAREIAESELGSEVDFQDVLNFLNDFPSITDYNNSLTETIPETTALQERFKSLTGVEATPSNIEKVISKETVTKSDVADTQTDEVPFQIESKQTKISGSELAGLVNRLKKTGLAENVIIVSENQVKEILEGIKEGDKFIETPNGFVFNENVYLNRNKVKKDTPIHEFGHLWNSFIKQNNPEVYKRGLDLIKNTEYHNDIKNQSVYSNLTDEQKLEEALAQAIGEKGVKIINESRKAKFATWFRNLFSRIAQGLGLRNLKGDQLADLTLEKFTDLAAGELLSGIEIREGRSPEVQKNQVADVTQIDVVVAERQATIKERERLKKIALSKKSVANDVKKQIIEYINEQTNKKTLSKTQKSDVTRLLNVIKNAKTKTNLLRAFETVNEVFTKIENRLLLQGINDILDRKLSKRESGRRKANLVTEEVEQILNFVKKNIRNIEKEVSVPLKRSTRNRINETLSNLFDQRQELVLKENKTNADYIELEGLVISIDILSGLASQNANTTNKNFTEALGSLDSLYNFGRSELKLLREERTKQDEELLKDVIDDVNPEGITTIKTDREIQADRKKITNSIQRLLFQAGSGWFSGNLDSIMTVISRRTGANRDSSPLVRLVNEMKSKETGKKRRISIFSNKVVQAQKDIFGSIKKSDIALNSRAKINVNRVPPGADLNTPKLQEELNFSNSQLLNLWMNNKNPKLKEGLEANGFDSKFFEQVEKILPSKVKEYGEALFNVYEELHIEADNVYKQINFHSMGKEDFYAGKVYRTDVEVKPEDLKINAGNYSINTTGFGSQKERTANDKPIEAMDVNTLVIRAIGETSHYVAFADVHRRYSKIIKDKGFVNAVNSTNKTNGDLILNMLNFYKERDLEKGGYRGNAILDALGRNISRSTLALKAKIGVTQTVSFFNGGIDMPKVSGLEFVKYYNPVELVKTMRELLNESDYLKNRYDVEGIENAMTGLSSIADKSEFSLNNNTLEANRKAASRFMKKAFEFALSNVKYGDMAGVAGAVPAYRAWLDTYKKQGLSDEQAKIKAIAKFESSVDRSQQTTSTFGKSPFQKHPIGRYFAMFATAPIQNLQNANYHWRELYRNLKKEGSGKGDNFRHIMGIMNYQFAQPMLYTYIANLMAGSLATALGFGDEEPDDLDKSLLSSAILSNYSSVPIFGSIATGVVDNIIGKEFSYGGLVSSAFFSTTDRLSDDIDKWIKARSKKESVKYRDRTLKQLSGLLIGLPSMVSDTFIDWDSIYWNDDVDESVKLLKAMGYSNFLIEKSLTPRVTREEAKKKKRILEKKYKKSINKYDKQSKKTNPLFSKKNKKKR